MIAFRPTFNLLLLLTAAAGQVPLWLHQADGCGDGAHSEACTEVCSHELDLQVPAREAADCELPSCKPKSDCSANTDAAEFPAEPSWVEDFRHHDCSLCSQLSQSADQANPPNVDAVTYAGEFVAASDSQRESFSSRHYSARGPPAAQ